MPRKGERPLVAVADEVLDESVVEHIAARDHIEPGAARQKAIETLRLVAARRQAQAALPGEPVEELPKDRVTHLLRAARARLWLKQGFEPRTRVESVPDDELGRVLGRIVHPTIHAVCQVIVMPLEGEAPTGHGESKDDPAWRERARALLAPLHRHIIDGVVPNTDATCESVSKLLGFAQADAGAAGLRFKFEQGGFGLDDCREKDDDGKCIELALAEEWSAQVRKLEVGTFSEPFFTRFGLHVVYLREVLPARERDDPGVDDELREAAHPRWRAEQFFNYLRQLRSERTVRILGAPDDGASAQSP